MNCKFCCGAKKELNGFSIPEYKRALKKLKEIGCKTIVFSGGEPLMRKDIVEILGLAKKSGFVTYLSSNGLLLLEMYDKIKDKLDCLGLPLDGSNKKINIDMTRDAQLFSSIKKILEYFKIKKPNHKVKIGTIISAKNKHDIKNIAKFLFDDNNYNLDTWRLYQFTPINIGKENRNEFEINDAEFKSISQDVIKSYPNKNISPLPNEDNYYVFINPEMQVEILTGEKIKKKGNFLDLNKKELKKIFNQNSKLVKRITSNRRWLND